MIINLFKQKNKNEKYVETLIYLKKKHEKFVKTII